MYYLFRSGYSANSVEYVNQHIDVFTLQDPLFLSYIEAYTRSPTKSLPQQLYSKITVFWNKELKRGSHCPFKLALYKMLGKCELSKKKCDSLVIPSVEDYLWFNLSLLTYPENTTGTPDAYTIHQMRTTMKKYGKAYFGDMYTKVNQLINIDIYIKGTFIVW